jgi:hypothetical protein
MKVYKHEDVLKMLRSFHNLEMNVQLCMLKLTPIDMEEKLLEYWNGGIKSTEEGGKSFDQYHNEHHEDNLDEMPTSSQTEHNSPKVENKDSFGEISDEEIEKGAENAWSDYEYEEGNLYSTTFKGGWKLAIKWYREQLKKKQ